MNLHVFITCFGFINLIFMTRSTALQFYALDNPCFDTDRLCSTHCVVVPIKNDVNCQFCYCSNPSYKILWPTTGSTTTTPTPEVTTSKYLVVNNISYAELQNPCELSKAMCPLFCEMKNVTMNGRICENCFCSKIILGKRGTFDFQDNEDPEKDVGNRLTRGQHDSPGHSHNQPVLHFDRLSTHPPSIPPTNNEYCPIPCHVITVTVDDWRCHTCHCPTGVTLSAMVRPCDFKRQWCQSNCTIKQETSLILPCDYCDCGGGASQGNNRQTRFLINSPPFRIATPEDCLIQAEDCPTHCHLVSIHSTNWTCHVCVCDQVIIPRLFIHHAITKGPKIVTTRSPENIRTPDPISTTQYLTTSDPISTTSVSISTTKSMTSPDHISTTKNLPLSETMVSTLDTTTFLASEQTTKHVTKLSSQSRTTSSFKRSFRTTTAQPTTTPEIRRTTTERMETTTQIKTSIPNQMSTSRTIEVTTAPPGGQISCYLCNTTECADTDLKLCNHGGYCMNTFVDSGSGNRVITRSCVTKETCNEKWWLDTADNPRCINMQKENSKSKSHLECNFCCTENGCNKNLIINEYLFVG